MYLIAEMSSHLLNENASTAMNQEAFMKKYDSYVRKYEKESAELERLQKIRSDRLKKADLISAFMFEIHEQDGMIDSFDERLWLTTMDKVLVHHDGRMVFRFKNGTEVTR